MLVMLVLGIIIMAMGIAVGVQAGSPTPASSMVVALGVFVILGAINFTYVRPPDN
jgi:hypothetical protein